MTKMLINCYFNISSFIATIHGANTNLGIAKSGAILLLLVVFKGLGV